ncbi:MAG TPA: peptidoglycan endopeptidase [Henriciella sp.]|nr:peptidoglycan endopeptidase [Henriciella sp.]
MPYFSDPRLTPPRRGRGLRMQVSAGVAALRDAPRPDAEMVTQALHGETVILFGEEGEFGLVQMERDRYVGWTLMDALSAPVSEPTHRVSALRTYAYSQPHLKSAPFGLISMGSAVTVTSEENGFLKTTRGGWLTKGHVQPIDSFADDPADVALRFLHSPYLWGGCESLGLDCTGLTRAAFLACGVTLPRDSDMQFSWCGEAVADWNAPGALKRNDLVFWKGHVGIMLDDKMLLHANGYHMAVATEPLLMAIPRIAKEYGEPKGARRIDISKERGRVPDWLATN